MEDKKIKQTAVWLNDEEAQMFQFMMKNYDNFLALSQGRVFETKRSTVTLDIDTGGVIRKIEVRLKTYTS